MSVSQTARISDRRFKSPKSHGVEYSFYQVVIRGEGSRRLLRKNSDSGKAIVFLSHSVSRRTDPQIWIFHRQGDIGKHYPLHNGGFFPNAGSPGGVSS